MNNFTITDLDNLLIQMKAGLLPEQLDIEEVNMLREVYGINWFNELGYTEDNYNRSKYDHYKNPTYYREEYPQLYNIVSTVFTKGE
jgi:hypothetical protein